MLTYNIFFTITDTQTGDCEQFEQPPACVTTATTVEQELAFLTQIIL